MKLDAEKLSTNEQIAEIKLTFDLISNVLPGIESTAPNQETDLNTMVRYLYSVTKNSLVRHQDTISRYSENTKDTLTAAHTFQETLETKGSKEERKLQKQVVDSIQERMEKAEKLEELLREK